MKTLAFIFIAIFAISMPTFAGDIPCDEIQAESINLPDPLYEDTGTGLPFYEAILVSGVDIAYTPADGDYSRAVPSLFFAHLPASHNVTVIVNSERNIPHDCFVWFVYPDGSASGSKHVPPEPGYHFKTTSEGVYGFACFTTPGEVDLIGQIVYDGIIIP